MASLMPWIKANWQDDNGAPLSGGKVYTFTAGTSTPLDTYKDAGEVAKNTNPIILDSRGEADIYLDPAFAYKFEIRRPDDTLIYSVDNVIPSGDNAIGTSNGKVLVSTDDPVASFLNDKLEAGSGIAFSIVSGALGEKIEISANGADLNDKVSVSENDTTPDYLDAKVVGENNISITIENDGADEVMKVNTINDPVFNTASVQSIDIEGQTVSWNGDFKTIEYDSGLGLSVKLGQTQCLIFYNDTGATLPAGKIMHLKSATLVGGQLIPTYELADASQFEKTQGTLGITGHSVDNGEVGLLVRFGQIKGLDTTIVGAGKQLWLSADGSGDFTDTKPAFPNYSISVGGSANSTAAPDGEVVISFTTDIGDLYNDGWVGTSLEKHTFTVASDGTTIVGTLVNKADAGRDVILNFSDGFYRFDTTTAPATINLTAGTDTSPVENFVYIPKSTKVLTTNTTGFPTEEHFAIAKLYLQSAATTQVDDILKNHNWNDYIKDITGNGYVSVIAEAIREKIGATWKSGCEGTSSITTNIGTPDNVDVATTSGVIRQMHNQSVTAMDTSTGSPIRIINDSTTPNKRVTDLNGELTDASGNSMSGETFSIVVWAVANSAGEPPQLMANLPVSSYDTGGGGGQNPIGLPEAINDVYNYAVYDIPPEYQGVGFLVARFTYSHDTASGGTWTLEDTEDLRGKLPNVSAGGSAGGTGVTSWTALTDTPSSYIGEAGKVPVVNVGETALEFLDIADGYVPYTGATKDVDLGTNDLMAGSIDLDQGFSTGNAAGGIGDFAVKNNGTTQFLYNSSSKIYNFRPRSSEVATTPTYAAIYGSNPTTGDYAGQDFVVISPTDSTGFFRVAQDGGFIADGNGIFAGSTSIFAIGDATPASAAFYVDLSGTPVLQSAVASNFTAQVTTSGGLDVTSAPLIMKGQPINVQFDATQAGGVIRSDALNNIDISAATIDLSGDTAVAGTLDVSSDLDVGGVGTFDIGGAGESLRVQGATNGRFYFYRESSGNLSLTQRNISDVVTFRVNESGDGTFSGDLDVGGISSLEKTEVSSDDNGTGTNQPLSVRFTGATQGNEIASFMSPNSVADASETYTIKSWIGREFSNYNGGYLSFGYTANSSSNNFLSLGFYGADNLFKFRANGNATFSGDLDVGGDSVFGGSSVGRIAINAITESRIYFQGSGTDRRAIYYNDSNKDWGFYDQDALQTRMKITGAGDVSITNDLDVGGQITGTSPITQAIFTGTTQGAISIGKTGQTAYGLYSGATGQLGFYSGTATDMLISGGDVSITNDLDVGGSGISAVTARLQSKTAAVSQWSFIGNSNGSNYAGFYHNSSNQSEMQLRDASGVTQVVLRSSGGSSLSGDLDVTGQIARKNGSGFDIIAFGQSSNAGILSVKSATGVEQAFIEGTAGNASFNGDLDVGGEATFSGLYTTFDYSTSSQLVRNDTDTYLGLSGDVNVFNGANILLYGSTATGNVSTGRLRSGSTSILSWNSTSVDITNDLDVGSNVSVNTDAVTLLGASQAVQMKERSDLPGGSSGYGRLVVKTDGAGGSELWFVEGNGTTTQIV